LLGRSPTARAAGVAPVLALFPSSLAFSLPKKFSGRILFTVGQFLGHCKKKVALRCLPDGSGAARAGPGGRRGGHFLSRRATFCLRSAAESPRRAKFTTGRGQRTR